MVNLPFGKDDKGVGAVLQYLYRLAECPHVGTFAVDTETAVPAKKRLVNQAYVGEYMPCGHEVERLFDLIGDAVKCQRVGMTAGVTAEWVWVATSLEAVF